MFLNAGICVRGYRFTFQSQESDDELRGKGNSLNYKFRMHDPRIGRFFAVDPLAAKYPWNSSYAFSENIVIHSIEFEGLEAVVGVSMGGDVDYRKSHLEKLHASAVTKSITSPTSLDSPSEIRNLSNVLTNATTNDPTGKIGFVGIWGHGWGGNVIGSQGSTENPTGELYTDDLEGIQNDINNGSIAFTESAIICITACNAGSDDTSVDEDGSIITNSFAQKLANITGATVVAGRDVNGDGGVSPLKENAGIEMSYQMRNYAKGSFFQFNSGETPIDIGNKVDFSHLINRGRETQISRMEPRKPNRIQ